MLLRSASDYASDTFIALSTWAWMEAQSKTGKQPIYRYRFDMAPPSDPNGPQLGAYHSAEIEYVFGQLDSKADVPWRPEDRALSEQMLKYWSELRESGDPNGPGLAEVAEVLIRRMDGPSCFWMRCRKRTRTICGSAICSWRRPGRSKCAELPGDFRTAS